jgi:hypothetical protein
MKRASNTVLLAISGLAVLLSAGCGGEESAQTTAPVTTEPPVTTAAAPDPGGDAIAAFVAAAGDGEFGAMWELLSTSTRQRLGPTLADFRAHSGTELIEGVGSFRRVRVIVSERITPELGVVAIDGSRVVEGSRERQVYAVAMRLEGSSWKLELGGPVTVRPIGPDPGARERVVAQVAAAVGGPAGVGTAVMYVDGQTVSPNTSRTSTNSTLYANIEPSLEPGRHTVVVFASEGREASALGWAFTVTGPRTP